MSAGSITLRGVLVTHGHMRLSWAADGYHSAWVYANICTEPGATPVQVRFQVPGRGYAAQVSAATRADALRKGRRAWAKGSHLIAAPHGGLVLAQCELLELDEESDVARAAERVAP